MAASWCCLPVLLLHVSVSAAVRDGVIERSCAALLFVHACAPGAALFLGGMALDGLVKEMVHIMVPQKHSTATHCFTWVCSASQTNTDRAVPTTETHEHQHDCQSAGCGHHHPFVGQA